MSKKQASFTAGIYWLHQWHYKRFYFFTPPRWH